MTTPLDEAREARATPVEIVVVAQRCIYINDHRVAGSKPWASENLPQHSFVVTLGEVLDAFPRELLSTALAKREGQP